MARTPQQLTATQKQLLRAAFTPHTPIDDPKSFFGREDEIHKIRDALAEPGLQIVVHGAPGCGKTSLANVATNGCTRVKIFCPAKADFSKILDDTALAIQKLYPETIGYDASRDVITKDGVTIPLSRLSANTLLSLVPNDTELCIILDELDRVKDAETIESIAELAKNIATNHPKLTLLMVGVSDTANGLLRGHTSNFRNLQQVPLERMSDEELAAILARAEQVLQIRFSPAATQEVLNLCDGMPYYLHLLAKHAARVAMEGGSATVEIDDVNSSSLKAAAEAHEQLRTAYRQAISPPQTKRTFQKILWTMAKLQAKANSSSTITTEANNIWKDEPLTEETVRLALAALATPEQHQIVVERVGAFSFTNPLMKGYVRLLREPAQPV